MYLLINVVVGVIVAGLATALTQWLSPYSQETVPLLLAYTGATVLTAVLISLVQSSGFSSSGRASANKATRSIATASKKPGNAGKDLREVGSVKWFNVSKGYGFITKDDGQEIFVHFRSIKGGGRRGLRDGQRVSFIVAHSEKGPQAEEVERTS
ncbi:MAG: cold shock domain-containing protein [Pseudomonadota bacterium]